MEKFDVIILGGGAAGLSAGLYSTRAMLKTLILESVGYGGQILVTDMIDNYPGFPEGIRGPELSVLMEQQTRRFGAEMRYEEITGVEKLEEPLKLVHTSDATYAGKTRILCTVPSLDTSVCEIEMKKFNEKAPGLKNSIILCVSTDLPFAHKRWCGANGCKAIITASDHRERSLGRAYGCLIQSGPLSQLLCRAVFVIDPDDTVQHVEYVRELTEEPDYEAVLKAAGRH